MRAKMPFFFPSALLTNFTKSSPRSTISSALRYQMLQNCKISAGSMTSRILIVTPAILRQFTDANSNSFALPLSNVSLRPLAVSNSASYVFASRSPESIV